MTIELSTRGAVIKAAYEAEDFTRVRGPGQGAGNVITKTLKTSGGDFSTFDEVMDYISGNTFDNVQLDISIYAGTFALNADGQRYGTWILNGGNGINRLRFIGQDKNTCILSCQNDLTFKVRNSYVVFEQLKINDARSDGWYFLQAYNSYIEINECITNEWYWVVGAFGSTYVSGYNTTYTSSTNQYTGPFTFNEVSTGIISGCTLVGHTSKLNGTSGVYAYDGSRVKVSNTTIQNFKEGIHVEANSSCLLGSGNTLSGNTSNYSIPLNQMHGDGSYITNGSLNAAKSPSSTVANLPSAATVGAGARGFVTDANATTFLSIVASGGSNKVPVVSDGTNWLIG